MRFALQDPHLEKLRDDQMPVAIVLTNGVKLFGHIVSFDQFVVVVVAAGDVPQMVYKQAISHIQVSRPDARPRARSNVGVPSHRETLSDHAHTPAKEPVVIVRKKVRTIVPADKR